MFEKLSKITLNVNYSMFFMSICNYFPEINLYDIIPNKFKYLSKKDNYMI